MDQRVFRGAVVALLMAIGVYITVALEEDVAGSHIDRLSNTGIKILLTWKNRFQNRLDAIAESMDNMDAVLDAYYTSEAMPNFTALALDGLADVNTRLVELEAQVDGLGLNATRSPTPGFMSTINNLVNTGDHFSQTQNSDGSYSLSGTFIVPQDGLYKVVLKANNGYAFTINCMRNGDETLISLYQDWYYDGILRVRLAMLSANDTIYLTGSLEYTTIFSVHLLTSQDLMPSFL